MSLARRVARLWTAALLRPVLVYVLFAALMSLSCVVLTPPGQTPDERNHLARITQISRGHIVGTKLGSIDAGGEISQSFPLEFEMLDDLRGHAERQTDLQALHRLASRPWVFEQSWVSFPNTVIYAPFTYIPAAIVTFIARHAELSIVATDYAIRAVNAIASVTLTACGLALARRGTLLLLLLACLPMTIALGASCSQDGILFGVATLATGLMTRLDPRDRDHTGNAMRWGGLALCFALLAVSKPTLLPCALIAPALSVRGRRVRGWMPLAAGVAALSLWTIVGVRPAKMQFHAGLGVSDGGQIAYLLAHPLRIPALAWDTLAFSGHDLVRQFVGVLGWLDTSFPDPFYTGVYVVGAAVLSIPLWAWFFAPGERQDPRVSAAVLSCVMFAAGSVFFLLYLVWTPVGSPRVEGVQGRYFLLIAPFLALLFPAQPGAGRLLRSAALHQCVMVFVCVLLALDTATLTAVLMTRYW